MPNANRPESGRNVTFRPPKRPATNHQIHERFFFRAFIANVAARIVAANRNIVAFSVRIVGEKITMNGQKAERMNADHAAFALRLRSSTHCHAISATSRHVNVQINACTIRTDVSLAIPKNS